MPDLQHRAFGYEKIRVFGMTAELISREFTAFAHAFDTPFPRKELLEAFDDLVEIFRSLLACQVFPVVGFGTAETIRAGITVKAVFRFDQVAAVLFGKQRFGFIVEISVIHAVVKIISADRAHVRRVFSPIFHIYPLKESSFCRILVVDRHFKKQDILAVIVVGSFLHIDHTWKLSEFFGELVMRILHIAADRKIGPVRCFGYRDL